MKWRRLVSEQARSGQSVKAFCCEHGLCRPYLRVEEAAGGRHADKTPLEVQVAGHGPSTPGDSSVEIRLRNGRSLMVRPGCRCRTGAGVAGGGGGGGVIGLPSLQAIDRARGARIWMASEARAYLHCSTLYTLRFVRKLRPMYPAWLIPKSQRISFERGGRPPSVACFQVRTTKATPINKVKMEFLEFCDVYYLIRLLLLLRPEKLARSAC